MGDTGLEKTSISPGKTTIAPQSAAESGAVNDSKGLEADPDLQSVINAWPRLSADLKQSIVTLITICLARQQ